MPITGVTWLRKPFARGIASITLWRRSPNRRNHGTAFLWHRRTALISSPSAPPSAAQRADISHATRRAEPVDRRVDLPGHFKAPARQLGPVPADWFDRAARPPFTAQHRPCAGRGIYAPHYRAMG